MWRHEADESSVSSGTLAFAVRGTKTAARRAPTTCSILPGTLAVGREEAREEWPRDELADSLEHRDRHVRADAAPS
jgi:hypothetical protein